MIKGLFRSASGMIQKQYEQDTISNNLANVNTAGFKKEFTLANQTLDSDLALQLRFGKQDFSGTINSSITSFTQGSLTATGNPLDIALNGEGFIAVNINGEEGYTRNGNLKLDANGRLVTNSGYPISGEGGEIFINGSSISISETGEIFADGEAVDKIKIVNIPNKNELLKSGESLFKLKEQTKLSLARDTSVRQGYIERSNVNIVSSMVHMIDTHRRYDLNSTSIKTIDETVRKLVNEVGRY